MSTYTEYTGVTIQSAFNEFNRNNPAIYEHFKRLAFIAIRAGKKKISAKMICNVIRWEVFIETIELTLFELKGEPKKFKINDAYTSRYARLFIKDFPEHEAKIELREIRSE